ncbi:MAG: hypothetical protein HZA78_02445 [Candidatus Schekmanbacteria bacterium]|nr:hypothetical protein [Candidatus Schekmanbacteria bacterium]
MTIKFSLGSGHGPLKREPREHDMRFFQQTSILMVMIGCFFIGTFFILLSNIVTWPKLESIVAHIGTAFYVVTILGCTVEYLIKKQLMKDVFEAAFGYVLPKILQPELQWICNQTIICTDSDWVIDLKFLDDDKDTILLHAKNNQIRENFGINPIKHSPFISIDDWFSPKRESNIIQLDYTHNTKKWPPNDILPPKELKNSCTWHIQSEETTLKKGEKIYLNYEFEEIKRSNDVFIAHVAYITKRTKITIKKPDDIGVDIGFAQRESAKRVGPDVYIIEATQLPYQFIQVRWWEKNKVPNFVSSSLPESINSR